MLKLLLCFRFDKQFGSHIIVQLGNDALVASHIGYLVVLPVLVVAHLLKGRDLMVHGLVEPQDSELGVVVDHPVPVIEMRVPSPGHWIDVGLLKNGFRGVVANGSSDLGGRGVEVLDFFDGLVAFSHIEVVLAKTGLAL